MLLFQSKFYQTQIQLKRNSQLHINKGIAFALENMNSKAAQIYFGNLSPPPRPWDGSCML